MEAIYGRLQNNMMHPKTIVSQVFYTDLKTKICTLCRIYVYMSPLPAADNYNKSVVWHDPFLVGLYYNSINNNSNKIG